MPTIPPSPSATHPIEVVRVTIAETPNAGADWPPVA